MIAPYKWLCDYVDMDLAPDALMQKLIMTGSEVDGYTELGADIKKVVVGRIDAIEKHADADKLSVCMVDIGSERLQIVCGANNIFEGALVPVAQIGANLPGGFKITKGKLRGVFSYGMLCSGKELGISETEYPGADVDGIMILREEYKPGTPLREILGLTDIVFEIEVGANRPDCLSMLGIARECAASLGKNVNMPDLTYTENGGDIADYVTVDVKDADLCERYVARAVKNVKIGPSPKWLQDRLVSAGVRSINNIVDITNFVMLETGQPMHAFDNDDIRGKKIVVRRALGGERITTLDKKERALTDDMLLICDAEGAIGIAGVMGGENSEIKNGTKTVVFESAKFLQGNVRRTSRSLGLPTESAMRFSKGVDTAGCKTAMDRALHLVALLGAGEIVSGEIDILSADISPRKVSAGADKINAILGTALEAGDMAALLRRVFIETSVSGNTLVCKIPSFRGDITFGEDIAEEVARMFGYDNIPIVKMTGEVKRGMVSIDERSVDKIRALLVGLGCYECVTYSFAAMLEFDKLGVPDDDKLRRAVRIINPLGDEQGYLRTSPVPDILKVVSNNIKQKVRDIRLFETGRVYLPTAGTKELPEEHKYVCAALCGDEDFFSLKGIVENLLEAFGIKNARFEPEGAVYYHPGRCATVYAGGEKIGELGEIHPDVSEAYEIGRRVYVAELSLHAICAASDNIVKYEPLPKFPAAERDLALTVENSVPAAGLLECIEKNAGPYFESAALFDVYKGGQIGEGKKSLAFSIVFRAKDRTLLDEEANAARDLIVEAAGMQFGAKIRE
ncbi:MAG: phenylalanine--tRNA ligase subunit beta [Eubacteriales bacterium]|nr:phenylalanine--tRNA ligase subunit beta [Eubacteriales bacterium]